MTYDIHAHCIPHSFRTWLETSGSAHGAEYLDTEKGARVRFNDGFTSGPLREFLGDTEARIAAMDRMGIDVQVIAGWVELTGYDLEAASGLALSRAQNDSLAEEAATHPDRLLALGNVPLQDPSAAVTELERVTGELGMVGIQIATTVGDLWLDRANLDPVWEAAEALNTLIVLHPMAPLTGVVLDRYLMDNAVGRPAETTIALAGLINSGVFERFPRLRMLAVHGGGFLPFQIGRLDRSHLAKPEVAAVHTTRLPSEYMAGLYVDTVVHNPAALRFLIDTLGADHILLGTDYPFEMGDEDPVGLVDSVPGLESSQREAILSGNAARLFAP
jgi:aminocarboxymuconate-semialdehyde decarboxylase